MVLWPLLQAEYFHGNCYYFVKFTFKRAINCDAEMVFTDHNALSSLMIFYPKWSRFVDNNLKSQGHSEIVK